VSLQCSLTGLLSFMLSDEMTTGSVTTSDGEKRGYAARSHLWNIEQRRFKDAFPDYCTPTLRDLPNMAQKELGKAARSSSQPAEQKVAKPLTFAQPIASATSTQPPSSNTIAIPAKDSSTESKATVVAGWGGSLRQLIWEKWRWGVVLALAVIVSRLSSTS